MKYFNYESVNSTNDKAKQLCQHNPKLLESGCVVTADHQENGRGTKGRVWESSSKGGLYYSIAFKPTTFDFKSVERYHLDVAAAIQRIVAKQTMIQLNIKAPNDLYLNGKKVGGILMESVTTAGTNHELQYLIIGIGLNIGQSSFPSHLNDIATSLAIETNRSIDKHQLIVPISDALRAIF